jgi:aminoglycoside phosphotransferase (APT) family kinase protein
MSVDSDSGVAERAVWYPRHVNSSGAGLGDRIGVGRTAEVFAWRDGEILKLLRPGFPDRMGEREATIAARVDASDLAAPRFLGTERVDGRYGLVYERVNGPSMLDRLSARPWLIDALARRFAGLHTRMHDTDGAGLPDLGTSMRGAIERVAHELGSARVDAAFGRLDRLTGDAIVCHGDMHPGNVIISDSGPVVIDWLTARSGPAEADVARTLYLLIGAHVPGDHPRLQRALVGALRRRFAATYLNAYRRVRSIDERRLGLWRLPVLAARFAEDIEEEREGLLARIDTDLEEDSRSRWASPD